jgi:hypothetical protein
VEKGLRKKPGYSWIAINGKVHTFIVDDSVHLQIVEICVELERFSVLMNELWYAPETIFVLHDVEEEAKVFHNVHNVSTQCKAGHCIGLIATPPCTPLQIYRNIWLPYCHQVHCKAVCKSNHVKGCEVISSLP